MMKCKIRETDEIKELSMRDVESGVDWVRDFIGNNGGFTDGIFTWDDEQDCYIVSAEEFDWWKNTVNEHEALSERIRELEEEYGCEAVREATEGGAWDVDLGDQPASVNAALDEFEQKQEGGED